MSRKSAKRVAAEAIIANPKSSRLEKADAAIVIARLNRYSAYQSEYEKRRRASDPEYLASRRASKAAWKKRNPGAVYDSVRRHHDKRYNSDPKFRLDMLMRSTVHRAMTTGQKSSAYLRHLDWTFAQLRKHIEGQFEGEMRWENWGDLWELDHIAPRALFNYDSPSHPEFIQCWRLSNLKPTLRHENRAQGYDLSNLGG